MTYQGFPNDGKQRRWHGRDLLERRDHATETVTIRILASHAAAHHRASRLGIAASTHKAVSDQSISLIATGFGNAGLAQSFIVAICTHIATEGMHVPHEGNGKLRPDANYFSKITLRLVLASQLPQCSDENCVARPLEAWLRQGPQCKVHGSFIFANEIFGLGHTGEVRAHIRILWAQADCRF